MLRFAGRKSPPLGRRMVPINAAIPTPASWGALLAFYPSGPSIDKNHSHFPWNPEDNDLSMPRIIFGKYQR